MPSYTKRITNEDLDDLLVAAFEGGSNYWIESVEVKNNDYKGGEYASDVISRGGTLIIRDEEGRHELTRAKLLKGLSLGSSYDPENADAGDADNILQLALFGQLIYG